MKHNSSERRWFLQRTAAGTLWMGLTPLGAVSNAVAASRMDAGAPSQTALGAARHRAVHQILEHPRVLDDPYALRVLGPEGEAALRAELARYLQPASRYERAGIVLRSRYADDRFDEAVQRGVNQYVVLGAGLDTYAYRHAYPQDLFTVFEVDHPATQAWKRARLSEVGLDVPSSLTFAPVDFERESLAHGLERAGFRRDQPAFFSWLGVVIYLSEAAVMDTLTYIASLPSGTEVVFSFSPPWSALSPSQRRGRAVSAARVAKIGEPWITYFDPADLAARLRRMGFSETTLLTPTEANSRYFAGRSDGLRTGVSLMMAARV